MRAPKITIFAFGLMCALLTACSFAPKYERPEMDIPAEWRAIDKGTAPALSRWWERFNDPVLTALIDEALRNNQDIAESLAKLDSAQAQLGQGKAALLPTVAGTSGANAAGVSARAPNAPMYGTQAARNTTTYQGAFQATWEIDLWGKYRNAYTALSDVLLATSAGLAATRLAVSGQTAQGYFTLLALDMQLDTARRTLKSRESAFGIYTSRFRQGDITELDWLRAKSEVEVARAQLHTTTVGVDAAEASLAVLLGRSPRDIMNRAMERGVALSKLPAPPVLPAGVPSELLIRRPDIVGAEHMLMAYNSNIGVVRAEFFPSISLTGALGTLSSAFVGLFTAPAALWGYGVTGSMPLLDFGRTWYRVQDAEAQKRQAIAVYRKTVQNAFMDMRTALTRQREADAIVSSTWAQVKNMRRAVELARLQYNNGYADYLTVLDAERQLFSAEMQWVASMGDRLNAVVSVCMALGGGWDSGEIKKEGE